MWATFDIVLVSQSHCITSWLTCCLGSKLTLIIDSRGDKVHDKCVGDLGTHMYTAFMWYCACAVSQAPALPLLIREIENTERSVAGVAWPRLASTMELLSSAKSDLHFYVNGQEVSFDLIVDTWHCVD